MMIFVRSFIHCITSTQDINCFFSFDRLDQNFRRVLRDRDSPDPDQHGRQAVSRSPPEVHLGRGLLLRHVVVRAAFGGPTEGQDHHQERPAGNRDRRLGDERRGQLLLLRNPRAAHSRSRVAQVEPRVQAQVSRFL
jgi:hypothetical protein